MRSKPDIQHKRDRSPVDIFLAAANPTVIERVDVPPQPARYSPLPLPYADGHCGMWLKQRLGTQGAYRHQSLALSRVAAGANVVVSTPTASGKSLVFMAAALQELVSGSGRVLVFYPQKALASDQFARWQHELECIGLPRELVGEINGDVALSEREEVLARARVILATPDALHCWLMRMLHLPVVTEFLRGLRYVVIDEAHAFEGVFGSQFAFFFRRLRAARRRIVEGPEPQVIAATATLSDPAGHLAALTGMPFEVVGEEENGAPAHGLTLLHIDGPEFGGPAEKAAADIVQSVVEAMPADAAAIAFADSRQGVERIARRINRPDIKPYRSGFSARDRRAIEAELRSKKLRAILSTSASELGIDIPQFAFGINVGVPPTRKSLRQRKGRIGRSRPGVFAVVAPSAAFAKLGSSLRESAMGPVEQSPLYLGNPFIQFQQARCFLNESGCEDSVPKLEDELAWPAGFVDALALALPGAQRPRMLDEIASAGWDNPHLAYLLRSMPTVSFGLKNVRSSDTIGTIDHEKALREAYPGAVYFHLGTPYRVIDWYSSTYENSIKLQPLKSAEPTQPLIRFQVSASIEPAELIEGNLLSSDGGCLAETQLRGVESVEGYRIGSTSLLYRDLRETNRRLCRKQREFMTNGVILRIAAPWFAGTSENQLATRRAVAHAFETVIAREYNVAPGDIRAVHTGIALHAQAGARKLDDAVVVFDTVAGGLRLSAPLFTKFDEILARLERGAELAGTEALLDQATVVRLKGWHDALSRTSPTQGQSDHQDGKLLIFAPQSRVSVRLRGQLSERVLIEPQPDSKSSSAIASCTGLWRYNVPSRSTSHAA